MEHLLNTGRIPQTFKRARKSPCNWVGQKEKRERHRDGTWPSERKLWRREWACPWEWPSLVGRSARTEGELRSPGGEHSNSSVKGKEEKDPHRWSVLPSSPQTEMLLYWGGWGLGTEAWVSELRLWGERTGVGCMQTAWGGWLGCGVPQAREYGKMLGPTGEARPLLGGAWGGGGPTIGASFSEYTLRRQGTGYLNSRSPKERDTIQTQNSPHAKKY